MVQYLKDAAIMIFGGVFLALLICAVAGYQPF
jgi:hypothetical protein